jgi:hypothetical protein
LIAQISGQFGVQGQHPRSSIDVELGVPACVAPGLHRNADEVFAVVVQNFTQVAQQLPPLSKRQGAQIRASHGPRVL